MLSEIETGRIYSVTPRLSSLVDSRLTSRSTATHVDSRASSYGKFEEGEFERNSSKQTANIYVYTRGGANRVRTIAVFLEYWITGSEMFRWKRMAFRRGENIFGKYLNGTIISRVIYSILSTSKAFYICSVLGHRRNANGKITGQTRRRCRSTEDRMRISR